MKTRSCGKFLVVVGGISGLIKASVVVEGLRDTALEVPGNTLFSVTKKSVSYLLHAWFLQ